MPYQLLIGVDRMSNTNVSLVIDFFLNPFHVNALGIVSDYF